MKTTVGVKDLRLPAKVGVTAEERLVERELVIQMRVSVDLNAAVDDEQGIVQTVDYARLAEIASSVLVQREYRLLETIAQKIAQSVIALARVRSIRIRIEKPHCVEGAQSAWVDSEYSEADFAEPISSSLTGDANARSSVYPVVIVGGGPAGLSTALWCSRLNIDALVIDPGSNLGGQLHQIYFPIPDVPAMNPQIGSSLAAAFERQFIAHQGRRLRAEVNSVNMASSPRDPVTLHVKDSSGSQSTIRAQHIVCATGLRRRMLGVPGERELLQRGILPTASKGVTTGDVGGKTVVVVGGGDAACENALKLAKLGARVQLICRGAELSARATFRRELAAHPGIETRIGQSVARFVGEMNLEGIQLKSGEVIPCRTALVRIGWLPNNQWCPAHWYSDTGFLHHQSYALKDSCLPKDHWPRVWVVGDIRNPPSFCVANAMGDGANVARSISDTMQAGGDVGVASDGYLT